MMLAAIAVIILIQADASQQKDWGAMFKRQDAILAPLESKLGLPRFWDTWCRQKMRDDEKTHIKDNEYPLGIPNWRVLDRQQFDLALGMLDQWQMGEMEMCLANVKATQRQAGM